MRLFNVQTGQIIDCPDENTPRYAILSHTWDAQCAPASDFTFTSASTLAQPLRPKLDFACKIATLRGIQYLWVDFLCINTSSSADVEEAINGSFRRLTNCDVCFAYLDDLPLVGERFDKNIWSKCRYWTRAWTLQEFILAKEVEFYDGEWNHCSSKTSPELLPLLSDITGIPQAVLLDSRALSDISLGKRISWFATQCSRREEDIAYSLSALTGASISVRYGEGATSAFLRLQEEIMHDNRDGSILAWRSNSDQQVRGLLARSPSEFCHFARSHESQWQSPWAFDGKFQFSSKGIQIESHTFHIGSFIVLAIGKRQVDSTTTETVGIYLREWNGRYLRVDACSETIMSEISYLQSVDMARDMDSSWTAAKIDWQISGSDLLEQETKKPVGQLAFRLSSGARSTTFNCSNDIPGSAPLSMQFSGTKRRWSGEPTMPGRNTLAQSSSFRNATYPATSSHLSIESEDESLSDSSQNSDDNSESEEDHGDYYYPSEDLEFQAIRPTLFESLYRHLLTWLSSAKYTALANDQLPPRKRARTSKRQSRSMLIEEEHNDTGFVVVSKIDGYFHLACPYYVRNPEKHQDCIASHDLQSIEDVIHHLRQQHQQPPYCPLCRRAFKRAIERDTHVRENLCTTPTTGEIEGLDHGQVVQLSKRDSPYLGETTRWMRAWKTVFPGIQKPDSPYLDHGAGLAVSLARDHWFAHGREHISQHPISCDLMQRKEDFELAAIRKELLNDLLIRVMKEHGLGKGAALCN